MQFLLFGHRQMRVGYELFRLAACGSALVVLLGCHGKGDAFGPVVPSGSSVQITSIAPNPGEALHPGQTVDFKVEATYTLTGDTGTVALIVQAADGSGLAQPFDVVKKGSGKTTLEASVVVPNTDSLEVMTPLVNQGPNTLTAIDRRTFKVSAK
jgi:hypothetical protein